MKKLSEGEETLALHIKAHKLPEPEREYRFHSVLKWRFDFAWPALFIAVEIEGGIGGVSRHSTLDGFIKDCNKYNAATRAGWYLLRYTTKQVKSGQAVDELKPFLEERRQLIEYRNAAIRLAEAYEKTVVTPGVTH